LEFENQGTEKFDKFKVLHKVIHTQSDGAAGPSL
jgi:hypothetical protein